MESKITSEEFSNFFIETIDIFMSRFGDDKYDNLTYEQFLKDAPCPSSSLLLSPVTPAEIFDIGKLKNSKSRDYYGLNSDVLKLIAVDVAEQIAVWINQCFATEIFSDAFKINSNSSFKKGCVDYPNNFRPISIISILGKIM